MVKEVDDKIKVTWKIPSDIFRELKHKAIDDNVTVTELAVHALKDYLRKSKK